MAAIPPSVAAYIEGLERMIAKLFERVGELERELREGKRQATPFRRAKRKSDRKRAGRKGGHKAERRALPEQIDEEHDAPLPDRCPHCDGAVAAEGCYEQIQEDFEVRLVRRRLVVHVGRCVECQMPLEGRHPQQTSTARGAAAHQIGPHALALGTALHVEQGVPFDKVREHLGRLGLDLSTACLVRTADRLAAQGEPAFNQLLRDLLTQDILHIDETGWTIAGQSAWLWVLTGEHTTVYFARHSRSGDEIADFLADFKGVMVTDGAGMYDRLGKALTRALCLLHLHRNISKVEVKQTGGAVHIPRALLDWVDRVIQYAPFRDQLSPENLAEDAELFCDELDAILARRPSDPSNRHLLDRITRLYADVTRCLTDIRVPATNNFGERQIRPAVVLRKRGGCNRSERGARVFEILTSLAVTAKQRGTDFVQWLVQLLCAREPLCLPPRLKPG